LEVGLGLEKEDADDEATKRQTLRRRRDALAMMLIINL